MKPLDKKNSGDQTNTKPHIFLSLFEPSSIRLSDYNYISYSYDEKAYIFALFSPQSKAKFILSEDTHDQYNPKLKVTIGININI